MSTQLVSQASRTSFKAVRKDGERREVLSSPDSCRFRFPRRWKHFDDQAKQRPLWLLGTANGGALQPGLELSI